MYPYAVKEAIKISYCEDKAYMGFRSALNYAFKKMHLKKQNLNVSKHINMGHVLLLLLLF